MLHHNDVFLFICACLAALLVSPAAAAPAKGSVKIDKARIADGARVDLTGGWLYKPGYAIPAGERPQDPGTKDAGYVAVPVPQMLSRIRWWLDDSEGFKAFEENRLKALGFDTEKAEDGWYRLWIDLKKADLGDRRVFAAFDGVAMKCRAYLNGRELGEHTGMFSRFSFDLTPHIRDGRNLLAVYVSMEKLDPNVTPLGEAVTANLTASKVVSLSKGMFGPLSVGGDNRSYDLHGIWQPVRLEFRRQARIDDAWFIPQLDSAEVRVEVTALDKPVEGTLTARWVETESGKEFASAGPVPVKLSGAKQEVKLSASGLRPNLWTPERPNLYNLQVTLADSNGRAMDTWSHKVGFRTIEIRGHQIFLNGRRWWMRGANQLPYGKNPWDPALARKLVKLLHDGNCMVTRTHCTPWNEAWLDAADEIGLGVSIEGVRPWALVGKIPPPPRDMVEHWKVENEDVIRRCRNHPSVLMWTVGNEMTLRDDENVEKWKILSELVRQTRAVDPTRPVICSSGYYRKARFEEEMLKPNNLDDGDLDDLHSYRGWYATSPFVEDTSWIARQCDFGGKRPIIGQEMATGYPNLDDGLPVAHYAKRLIVPQAWVGKDGEAGGDPSVFLEHLSIVTKRLAEQLRTQRGDLTSGFMLFSSECWFRNTWDPARVEPYPVYDAVKQAFAPVGLSIETNRRRFFAGETVETAAFVVNDDQNIAGPLSLRAELVSADGKTVDAGSASLADLKYYDTVRVPLSLTMPDAKDRSRYSLRLRLLNGPQEISRTDDSVEVFNSAWCEQPLASLPKGSVSAAGIGGNLTGLLDAAPEGTVAPLEQTNDCRVVLLDASSIDTGFEHAKLFAENGGTVILLGAGKRAAELFPQDITRSRELSGEFVDMSESPAGLTDGLRKMDCKWWGRADDRAFAITGTHNLAAGGTAKPLASHIVVHGYIDETRKPDYITSPLVEIPTGKGRFIICDFALEDSAAIDPAARRFAANLIAWAVGR